MDTRTHICTQLNVGTRYNLLVYLYKVLVHGRHMAHSTLHVTDVVVPLLLPLLLRIKVFKIIIILGEHVLDVDLSVIVVVCIQVISGERDGSSSSGVSSVTLV